MKAKTKKFSSGIRLVAKKMDGIYSFSLGVLVGAGSSFEDADTNGYSHVIEHMSFKGTEKRTSLDISKEVDAMGGDINAYTSKDVTCFYTRAGKQYLEKCFDVLSDMYFNSTFPQEELKKEKQVICEEISIDEDSPADICNDLVAQALFGNEGYGLTVLGSAKNIKNITREKLFDFKNLFYTAENTVISIAGNFDYEQVCDCVEKYFNGFFLKNEGNNDIVVPPKTQFLSNFSYKFKEIEQSHIAIAFPISNMEKPYTSACAGISNILGGGMSSRLFQEIREKQGLAYTVYAYLSTYKNCGYFQVYCGTNPKNTQKAAEKLFEQLNLLVARGITEEELSLTKSQILGSTQLVQESTMAIMRVFGGHMLRRNAIYNIDENLAQFSALQVENVSSVAKDLFAKPFASAYVGKEIKDYDFAPKDILKKKQRKSI